MKILYFLFVFLPFSMVYSQPNCEAYKYYFKDTLKYEACIKAEEVEGHHQFSKAYQEILDESIAIDSSYAYAYRRKSVAYLKSGDFKTWKRLMDKAVMFAPEDNIGHRGYIRFLCFRDYLGALEDFGKLARLGRSTDHYDMAKALCYKSLGQNRRAIQILENHMNRDGFSAGLYDYLHLGMLYLEEKEFKKAQMAFMQQSIENELAENQFYLALTFKEIKKQLEFAHHIQIAKSLYVSGMRMYQDYIDPLGKIYLEDIEREIVLSTKELE